jgi:hypothetical protein
MATSLIQCLVYPSEKAQEIESATTNFKKLGQDTGQFHPEKKVNICWQAAANSPEQLIWRKAPRTI